MPESLDNEKPQTNNDPHKLPGQSSAAGGSEEASLEIIAGDKVSGDKIGGDKIGGDKIIAARDYVAKQIIIQQTAVASIEGQPPAPGDTPYKGLQYFTAADTRLFFGRDTVTARLVSRLHDTNFLLIVGASGSGKSSVVRAGLIPALEGQERLPGGDLPPAGRWQTTLFTPGARPLDSLAAALFPESDQLAERIQFRTLLDNDDLALSDALQAQGDQDPIWRRLLVVDQFEELFTLCKNEKERLRFLANLLAAINIEQLPLKLVLILRSDFYTHCLRYEALRPLLEQQQAIVGAMSRAELQEAILEPLAEGSWSIQEGLAQLILDEVGSEPGALPLLSHALLETWRLRRVRTLTLSGYQEAGGVRGAIAKTAESLYTTGLVDPEQQQLAKRIFLELVEPGANERDTRRRISPEQLHISGSQAAEARTLLDTLINARLVTADKSAEDQTETFEVAHEALIRNWPRLREWLDDEREHIRFRRQLERDAQEWDREERMSDYLYRGSQLARIEEDESSLDADLDTLSHAFVTASMAQEHKRKQRRNMFLSGAIIAAVVMFVLALLAILAAQSSQRQGRIAEANAQLAQKNAEAAEVAAQQAQENEQLAINQRRAARTQALSALSIELNQTDPELALLLALQASRLNQPGNQSVSWMIDGALRSALNPEDSLFSNSQVHDVPIEQLVFTPDGRQLYARDQDKRIVTWDMDNLDAPPTASPDTLQDIASFDGICDSHQLALVQHKGTLQLWDHKLDQLLPLSAPQESLFWTDVAISDDGQTVAAASENGPIYIWNTAVPGEPPLQLSGPVDSYAWAITHIPNSSLLASAGNDGTILLWSLDAPEDNPRPLVANGSVWRDVAASIDGHWLAAASENGKVHLWDLKTTEDHVIGEHDGAVRAVAFSPDGRQLVSGGEDSMIIMWSMADLETGTVDPIFLPGHEHDIRTLSFSCDSRLLASGAGDRTVRIWHMQGPAQPQPLPAQESEMPAGHTRHVTSLHFTEPDQLLVSAGRDGHVWAWEWQNASATPEHRTPNQEYPPIITIDDKAQRLATIADNGYLQIRSSDDKTKFLEAKDILTGLNPALALAPDGLSVVVAAGENNTQILFWDLRHNINERLLGEGGHEGNINQLLFSPDGRTLASASDDKTIRLWSLEEGGSELGVLDGHNATVETLAFSSDGRTLASGGSDNMIFIWDLNALESPPEPLNGHDSGISALAFSADGRLLASAATEDDLFIWDLDNLAEPSNLVGPHTGSIRTLAFSPDGRVLVSGSLFGEILLWPTLDELTGIGCQAVSRNLNWDEWQRFLPDEPYCPVCPDLGPHYTAIKAGVYDPASCSPDSSQLTMQFRILFNRQPLRKRTKT